ncbi:hypothetical protein BSKO_01599 [Bryopsis sp. KO-2023]|nr:hypothetical protein BSKO_01599 [Bryopsis sp. KO-2023]
MGEAGKKSFRENHKEVVRLLKKASNLEQEKGKIFVYTDLCDVLQKQASTHKEYRMESEVFHSITKLGRPTNKALDTRDVLRGLLVLLSTKSWKKLGESVKLRGCGNVGATTFLGSLNIQPKRRQQRRIFTAPRKALEKPTEVEDVMDSNDPTTKRTEAMYTAILVNGSTPFAETILDVGSFANTVVNLFCLLLLVNRGKITFSVSVSEGMLLDAHKKGKGKPTGDKAQNIMRINKKIWEQMKEVVKVEDCLMQVTKGGVRSHRKTQSVADEMEEEDCVDAEPELTAEERQPDIANPDPFGKRKATSANRFQVPRKRRDVAHDEGPSGAPQDIDDCTENGVDIARGTTAGQGFVVEDSDDGSFESISDEGEEPVNGNVDPALPDINFKTIISQANGHPKSHHEHNPGDSNVDGGRSCKKRKNSERENGEVVKTPSRRRSQVLSDSTVQKPDGLTPVRAPPGNIKKDDSEAFQTPKPKRRLTGSPRLSTARKKRRQELLKIESEKRNKDPRPVKERLSLNFPKSTPTPKRQSSITKYLTKRNGQTPPNPSIVMGVEPEEDEKKPMIMDLCVPSTVEEDGPILIDLTGEAPVVERLKRPTVIDLS